MLLQHPLLTTLLSLLLLTTAPVHSHGAPETPAELAFREAHLAGSRRSLGACSARLAGSNAMRVRKAKRSEMIAAHLQSRGLDHGLFARQDDIITGYGANTSCILTPEGEEGPYWINGSLIRSDMREDEKGIDLLLDIQVIDVRTCEPIEGVMLDFWQANATGVYSDYEAENTLGLTYLRGLQKTDANGLVQMTTIIPGWYAGRAQHIHVKAHVNYTVNSNNTISGGAVSHTGQMFFEQSTLSIVNELSPYNSDSNTFTLNTADRVIQNQQNTTYYDAFLDIRSLGYNLTAGVVGFINIAIDPTLTPAAVGGNAGSSGSGSGSPSGSANMTGAAPTGAMPSGSGGAPSGSMPTGALPTGSAAAGSGTAGTTTTTAAAAGSSTADAASSAATAASQSASAGRRALRRWLFW